MWIFIDSENAIKSIYLAITAKNPLRRMTAMKFQVIDATLGSMNMN